MKDAPQLFARIYARHGHRCPMSTLGGRLGQAAMRLFPGGEQVAAVYSRRTCALDGIAETTGCSEDNGTLIIQPDRRHMLTVQSGQTSIALVLSDWALAQADSYRDLCNRLEEGWAMLGETEQERRQAEMDAMLDDLLPRFWQAGEHELMTRVE